MVKTGPISRSKQIKCAGQVKILLEGYKPIVKRKTYSKLFSRLNNAKNSENWVYF